MDMRMTTGDLATPNLPSTDLGGTARFYRRLGFGEAYRDEGWLILVRGSIQIEFFPYPDLDPRGTIASCCIRVRDLDKLYGAWSDVGIPTTQVGIPRIAPPHSHSGVREFALIDPDGNLLRCLSTVIIAE